LGFPFGAATGAGFGGGALVIGKTKRDAEQENYYECADKYFFHVTSIVIYFI
jgi:hypothetical protein